MSIHIGDKVELRKGVTGVVVGINGASCEVKFDNEDLIPPVMECPTEYLTILNHGDVTHCPRCRSKWYVTQPINLKYYDCLKCGKRKEDIIAEEKEIEDALEELADENKWFYSD